MDAPASGLPLPGPGPDRPGPADLDASLPAGAFALAALRRPFGSFVAHETGTLSGADPEDLHDMRVASRRLRALLGLFAPVLPRAAGSLRRRLRRTGRVLGEVRDLDVQIAALEERGSASAEEADARALLGAVLAARRERARARLRALLASPSHARLRDSLASFLRSAPPRANAAAARPIAEVAPDLIEPLLRKLRKAGDALAPDSPPGDWHRVRIAGKRVRYALEVHAGVYGRAAEEMIEALTAVQDVLGDHQDAHVALDHWHALRRRRGGAARAFALGALAERERARAQRLRGRFPRAWRRVRGRRWKRLRAALREGRPSVPAPEPGP